MRIDAMIRFRCATFGLLALACACGWATENYFIADPRPPDLNYQETGPSWREAAISLPPWPGDAELIELKLDGPPTAFRYFIDGRQLAIGADQVVRYTLVIEGQSGSRNVSYEGIRCTPGGRYKVFAYGADGRFFPSEGSDWQPISDSASERPRWELWKFHLCLPLEFRPQTRKDILRSLARH